MRSGCYWFQFFLVVIDDFVFEDLNFDIDYIVSGVCFVGGIVDIGVQGVQGYMIFVILFGMGDFSFIQMIVDLNFDVFGINVYGVLYGVFYGVMEYYVMFQLLGYVLCNQYGIEFWFVDFFDVDVYGYIYLFGQVLVQFFNIFIFFVDYDVGMSGVDGDVCGLSWMMNIDMVYGCVFQFVLEVFMYFQVGKQVICIVFVVCVLNGGVFFDDIQVNVIGMYFLIYLLILLFVCNFDCDMVRLFYDVISMVFGMWYDVFE